MAAVIGSETTPTIGAVFISEHWMKEAQLATRKGQVLAGTVDTRYEAEMKTGRILHIAHVLNQAATAKSDNTLVVPDAQTPTNQDITVSRYYYTATNWQSQTQVQADIVNIDDIAGQMGYALQGQVETDLAALPDDATATGGTIGTFGQEFTMDDWETVWQFSRTALWPMEEEHYIWASSAMISAIRKLGTPINKDYTSANANALDNATMGKFLGFTVVESQYLESPASGQHDNGAHTKSGLILVRQQQPKVERQRILGDISDLVVAWELFITAEREWIAEAAGAESLSDAGHMWLKSV